MMCFLHSSDESLCDDVVQCLCPLNDKTSPGFALMRGKISEIGDRYAPSDETTDLHTNQKKHGNMVHTHTIMIGSNVYCCYIIVQIK